MNNRSRINADEITKLTIFALLCTQVVFNNGMYLFACYGLALYLFYILSQPYKPAVFTIVAINHILQIVAGVWLANYQGKDINYRSYYTDRATILSLVGLIFLIGPVIYQQCKLKKISLAQFKEYAHQFSTQKTLNCYIIAIAVVSVLSGLAFIFPGLTQIIFSVVKIKWFFFLLFGYQVLLKNEKKYIFYLLVVFEFLSGFYSFFSEFKIVIYYLAILLLTFISSINFKQFLLAAFLGAFLLIVGLLWTSIKSDYRAFLNKGSTEQIAAVSQDEAMDRLLILSSKANDDGIEGAMLSFLDRIQYTYHFGKTLERVPDFIPFQNGANWMANIEFSTTPRFLNPNKPTIDNSLKATKYTGIKYNTAKQGTSFSLGYFAEFYVDFGAYLMMPAILLLGLVYGWIYKFFLTRTFDNPVFTYAVVGAFFFEFSNYEMDGTFLAGRLFASLVTFFALNYFFTKKLIRYISVKKNQEPVKDVQ